ncbi:unnamed protein product [Amoebophrya sp. A25]|nr:unnamed protein product [Amoebophrya sp. A25]|eukprot:GSA25T00008421001.1
MSTASTGEDTTAADTTSVDVEVCHQSCPLDERDTSATTSGGTESDTSSNEETRTPEEEGSDGSRRGLATTRTTSSSSTSSPPRTPPEGSQSHEQKNDARTSTTRSTTSATTTSTSSSSTGNASSSASSSSISRTATARSSSSTRISSRSSIPTTTKKLLRVPTADKLVFKNPDGSLAAGFGPDYRESEGPPSPKFLPSWLDDSVADELEGIYNRHERILTTFLVVQFLTESVFNGLYLYYSAALIDEMALVYPHLGSQNITRVFWAAVAIEAAYETAYYACGFLALWRNGARQFKCFADVAFYGCILQVLFAFVNKFNLVMLLFRAMAYLYGRFFRNFLKSVAIVQRTGQQQQEII